MTSVGRVLRSGHIFRRDGRTMVVAMDHARLTGSMPGLKDPGRTIESVMDGGADAIMTNFGVIKQFHDVIGGRVATILRLDSGPSVYASEDFLSRCDLLYSVREAAALGADGVIVFFMMGAPCEFDTIKTMGKVAEECESFGMPLLVEALPGGEGIDDPHESCYVSAAVRIAQEYGADFVKTYYTGSPESFKDVIENCSIPVLIAGGSEGGPARDVLEMAKGAVDAGGRGVVFGRNVWAYKDPAAMTRAISGIIHDNATVEEAMKEIEGA